ncbi:MAG: ATP-binding cassette domain-containing protein [Candidatus Lokiarchaeota archaeon]|nr:ATP-binding cassette domain-containing protein [Candidatus Lokiarchaeota archaeon]
MITVKNLTFSYPSSSPVFEGLNFELNLGEIVLITGPTGSGKSTLAKCLAGFIPHHIKGDFSGSITIDCHDTKNMSLVDVSQKVGIVQQDTESQICTLNVLDEVAFGPENFLVSIEEIKDRIYESLKSVKSLHLRNRRTLALSGGEKQRIVIASILSAKPRYILLDEPTSNLDPLGIKQLLSLLVELKEKRYGILCIAHNIDAILPVADRALLLKQGILSPYDSVNESKLAPIQKSKLDYSLPPLLSTKGLCFSYELGKVIRNVSLSVYPGEIIGLMGDNGSGKTTLLRLLCGLLVGNSGQVQISGKSLQNLGIKEIAKHIAIVFQNPVHQIFESSVWKESTLSINALSLQEISWYEQAELALREFGLFEKKESNPFSLSHGQKRRLTVLSSLIHSPEILLFDEPFIGQDLIGRELITKSLSNHSISGGACIIVTHNAEFCERVCTRLLFLDSGQIVLDGSPTSVFKRLRTLGKDEYCKSGGTHI